MVSLGTGIGGGLWLNGEVYRGASGLGAELGHVVLQLHGPDCPGDCPGSAASRRSCPGTRSAARACGWPLRARPTRCWGGGSPTDKEIDGGIVTELAHAGDALAPRVLAEIGERLGFGLVGLVNTFNPEVIVIGGGAARGGDLILEPARAVVASHALPGARDGVRIVLAHYGDEAGMMGAAPDGARLAGRARVTGRLVVCPTPIGNLEDVTLRVLSALREADVVACEDTRRTRVLLDRYGVKAKLVSYHEHNEQARVGGARGADARRGGRGARVRRGDAARLRPGLPAGARVRGGRAAGGGAAGAVGGDHRARRVGAAGGRVALPRVPAAEEGRAAVGALRASPPR